MVLAEGRPGLDSVRYSVKTIEYDEPDGPGLYSIMAIKFSGMGHQILEHQGWRGTYTIFMRMDGDVWGPDYDPIHFANEITASDDNYLSSLLMNMEADMEVWKRVEDGGTYTADRITELIDEVGD